MSGHTGWSPSEQKLYELVKPVTKDRFLMGANKELVYAMEDRFLKLAIRIIHRLKTEDFLLVAAGPQIGKSMVMLALRFIHSLSLTAGYRAAPAMIRYKKIIRRSMPVISAVTRDEVVRQLNRKVYTTHTSRKEYHLGQVRKLINEKRSPYEPHHTSEWRLVFSNAIGLVDEGHMDRSTNSTIEQYVQLAHQNGSKMVFFTAEPNQFILADKGWIRRMLVIEHRSTYHSIPEMIRMGLVHQASQIRPDTIPEIAGQVMEHSLTRFRDLGNNGYLIVRVPVVKGVKLTPVQIGDMLIAQLRESGMDLSNGAEVCEYNYKTAKTIDIQEMMTTTPPGLVVVVIKGMLRAGVSLCSKNIVGMYDSHRTTNIGSCINSLIGRVCGYGASPVPIWCDLSKAELYGKTYDQEFDLSRIDETTKRQLFRYISHKSFHSTILRLSVESQPPEERKVEMEMELKLGQEVKRPRDVMESKSEPMPMPMPTPTPNKTVVESGPDFPPATKKQRMGEPVGEQLVQPPAPSKAETET